MNILNRKESVEKERNKEINLKLTKVIKEGPSLNNQTRTSKVESKNKETKKAKEFKESKETKEPKETKENKDVKAYNISKCPSPPTPNFKIKESILTTSDKKNENVLLEVPSNNFSKDTKKQLIVGYSLLTL